MSSEEAGKAQLEGVVKQIGVLDAENEKKKQIEEKLALLKKELEIATIERQLSGMDKIEKEMAAQKENLQKVMVAQKAEADKLALSLHTLHSSHPKLVAPNIVARADQYLPMASTGVKAFSSGQNMQLLDLIVKLNQPLCALGPAKSGNLELRQKPVLDISAWDIKEAKRLWINEHTREDSSTSDTETTISSMNGHSISAGLNAGLSVPGTVGGSLGLKFDKSTTNSNSNSQQRSTTSLRLFRSKVVVVSEVDFQRKQFAKEAYAEAKGINSVESAQKFINTFGAWIPSGKWKLGGSYTIIHTATSTADKLSEKDISEIKTSYGGEVSAQKGPVSGGGSGSIGTTDVTSGSNVKASSNYTIETTSHARGISNFNPTQDQIQALYDYNMTWEVVEALDVLDEECIPVSDIAFWEGLGTAAHYLKEAISKIDLNKKVEPAPLTNKQKLESHQAFSTWLRNVGTGKYLYHKTTWDSKANRPDGDYLNQTGCQDKWNFVPCAGSATEYNLQYDATKQYLSIDGSRARTRAWNESEERFTLFVDGVVENLVRIRIKSRSFPRYLTANTNGNDIEIPELSDSRAKGDDTAVWLIPLN